MLAHATQVRACAFGVRRPPCRRRAAAAPPRCAQQVATPHPDIAEVLLQPPQIAARVQEVGRCASSLLRARGAQSCALRPPGACMHCTARCGWRPVRRWLPPMHALAAAAAHPPVPLPPRRQIAADYADRRPLIIGTLKGAVLFLSDLVRAIEPLPPGLQVRAWVWLRSAVLATGGRTLVPVWCSSCIRATSARRHPALGPHNPRRCHPPARRLLALALHSPCRCSLLYCLPAAGFRQGLQLRLRHR